jgi:hypothetical protein
MECLVTGWKLAPAARLARFLDTAACCRTMDQCEAAEIELESRNVAETLKMKYKNGRMRLANS